MTTNAYLLLPTIRSRCQLINLTPLGTEDVGQVLILQGLSLPDFLTFSEGSPGRVMGLMEGEGPQLYADLQVILKGAEPSSFIHTYGGEDKAYGLIEDFLRHFVHDHLLAKVEGRDSFFAKDSLDTVLKICEKIEGLFDQCRIAQLDRKATLTCVFAILGNRN